MSRKNPSSTPGDLREKPEDLAESLRRAEAATAAESLASEPDVSQKPAEIVEIQVTPSPFLAGAIAGIVGRGVDISKRLGWSSPAAPELGLPEEKWRELVSQNAAIVIARRFPTLNNEASEEFALAFLVLPWLLMNLAGMIWSRRQAKPAEAEKPAEKEAA